MSKIVPQALSNSLTASFGCDAFFTLLKNVHQGKQRALLLMIAETFIEKLQAVDLQHEHAPLPQTKEILLRCNRALIVMLHPVLGHLGSSVKDMVDTRNYKGRNSLMNEMKAHFASDEHVHPLYEEVIKFSVGTKKHQEKMLSLQDKLEGQEPSFPALEDAIQEFPKYKKDLRPMTSDSFKAILVKTIDAKVGTLLTEKVQDANQIEEADLEILKSGLELFPNEPVLAEKREKLNEFFEKNATQLAEQRMDKFCKSVMKEDFDISQFSFQEMQRICPQQLTESISVSIMALIPVAIRALKHQARLAAAASTINKGSRFYLAAASTS